MEKTKFRKSPALEKMKKFQKEKHWRTESMVIAMHILLTLEKNGMTQKDLAEKLGKSPQWVNKICNGQQNLTIGTIKELEESLGISLFEVPTIKKDIPSFKSNYITVGNDDES